MPAHPGSFAFGRNAQEHVMIRNSIKRYGRPIVAHSAYYSGYCRLTRWQGARIVSYHGILDTPTNHYAISTASFTQQMQHLAEHYTPVTVDYLVDLLHTGKPIPPRAVAVTFDDGYQDVSTRAYPILQRFGIPATVFLPTALIGTRSSERAAQGMVQTTFLTWEEVCEMSRHNITFGSHTVHHVSLAAISRREAQYQLEQSRARLEDEIGQPVTGFAYPYGTVRDYNHETARLVADAGYRWAVTGLSGITNHRSNPFALRRTKLEGGDGLAIFAQALQGALDPWVLVDRLGGLLKRSPRTVVLDEEVAS